jgi:Cation transporter/ATPase, N-terminus
LKRPSSLNPLGKADVPLALANTLLLRLIRLGQEILRKAKILLHSHCQERSVDQDGSVATLLQMMKRSKESQGWQLEGQLSRTTGCPLVAFCSCETDILTIAYRTLSIRVTETVDHGVEPTKGHVQEIAELQWHKISVDEVIERLGSSAMTGLDENLAQLRLQRNGKNILSPPPTHRFRKM